MRLATDGTSVSLAIQALEPAILDEMVRRLVAEFQPEKIILFGSYAWGEPTEDSDVDLFPSFQKATNARSPECSVRIIVSRAWAYRKTSW